MANYSTHYNCCNAKDPGIASDAKFLVTICPDFVMLSKMFEHVWRTTPGIDTTQRRRDALWRAKNMLEGINAML